MNDMILNMLANDSFTVSDFKAVGLTADNTNLESEERYLNSQMIQENQLFKDEKGDFSKDKFHQYYLYATDFYNKLADDTYIEDLSKNTFYSKDNLFAPEGSKKIDDTPQFITMPNPFLQNRSLTRVGKQGDRTLSISEIAQSQKIYDSKTQTFSNESVNDRALGSNAWKWLGDLFSEPLVIAQWDEDGEHIDLLSGEKRTHKKGDYKYNENGTFYYETLNGRDVYGKQVLNKMNTLTVDGSAWNKYDFFDSDDLEQKSVIGNVMKNLALVGTMFIPYVGIPIRIASIATQSVGLLGALGKMFLGSDNEFINNMHGWSKTVNRQSSTEYAAQNTWCWENIINMIGDTVGQIAEQRVLFTHVPALFKGSKGKNIITNKTDKTFKDLVEKGAKEIHENTTDDLTKALNSIKATDFDDLVKQTGELRLQHQQLSLLKSKAALESYMESYKHLGSILSKTYMTGITVQDTYGEAKANGASDWEAFALTLGYAAGEAWILNTGLGEWIMPELHGDKLKYRSIINALRNEVKPLTENVSETATKEGRQNLFKKVFKIGADVAKGDYAKNKLIAGEGAKVILAHGLGESFEELSEELLADVSKSAFNTINWLRGDETRIEGTWENTVDRYAMSALGGLIGGGLSSAGTDFNYAKQLSKMTNESALQEIVYMINNDKINDFVKYMNKAELGNKYLSFSTDENGNFKSGTAEDNQDIDIKKALNLQIKLWKDVINAEGAKLSENSLFDALTLKDLRYLQLRDTKTAGLMFQEYNTLVSDIIKKNHQIKQLNGDFTNTDTNKKTLSDTELGELSKLKQELNDLRVQKDAFLSGKRSAEFIQTAMYEAQQALHGHKRGYIFEEWVKATENKTVAELSELELKTLKEKYKAYRDSDMKNDILHDARQFVNLVGLSSQAILQQNEYANQLLNEGKNDVLLVQNLSGNTLNKLNSLIHEENFNPDDFITSVNNELQQITGKIPSNLAIPYLTDELQQRLEYIATTPSSNDYTDDDKKIDTSLVYIEAFSEFVDHITQKFLDKGFIHPEVKNNLILAYTNVLNTINDFLIAEDLIINSNESDIFENYSAYRNVNSNERFEIGNNRLILFAGFVENLQNKIDQIKQLNSTPIIDLLEQFKISVSESNISVKNVLETVNLLLNQQYSDISGFTLPDEIQHQLIEINELVDLLASSIYATRVDKSSINNSFGYSKILNELNKKYGNDQWIELAEIEGENADLILQDLALIKQKIQFAKNLDSINRGQKLAIQTKIGHNNKFIFYNKFDKFKTTFENKLPDWNWDSINKIYDDLKLLKEKNDKLNKNRKFGLTPEEKIEIKKESIILEDAIYDFFQDNKDKLENIDELSKLITPEHFMLFDKASTLMTQDVDDLDDNQFIFSLAARAALKSSIFYNNYRKTFSDDLAPVPMQEQSVYLNVAAAMNMNVLNKFAKAYEKSFIEYFGSISDAEKRRLLSQVYPGYIVDSFIRKPDNIKVDSLSEKFLNIILTEGIAGSGKTYGVFKSTINVLNLLAPELLQDAFVVHSTKDNADTLKKDLQLTGQTFSSLESESDYDLIKYFYSDFDKNEYDKHVKLIDSEIKTDFKLKKDLLNVPKIIFIDEVSKYDYVQMKLLSEAAQHYQCIIYAAGDFDQISASSVIKHENTELSFNPNRLTFIRNSKLGLSFRSLNSQMSKNQKEALNNLNKNTTSHKLYYWENESELRGFKHCNSNNYDEIVQYINKIKPLLQQDEKIGFLYIDENSELVKKLENEFGNLLDKKSVSSAQGLENNYYIIDFNIGNTSYPTETLNKIVYTAITRAKVGGITMVDSTTSHQPIAIENIKEEESFIENLSEESIVSSSKQRKKLFDKLFENYTEELITYIPVDKIEKENEILDQDDSTTDEGFTPVLPPVTNDIESNTDEGTNKDLNEDTELDTEANTDENTDEFKNKEGYRVQNNKGEIIGTIKKIEWHPFEIPHTKIIVTLINDEEKTYTPEELKEYTLIAPASTLITTDIDDDFQTDLGENDLTDDYKETVDKSNLTDFKQEITPEKKIKHWLHTFNSYETGVLWKDDHIDSRHFINDNSEHGRQIKERTERRIDNVNGLIKLGKVSQNTTKEECLDLLTYYHSLLMHFSPSEIIKKLTRDSDSKYFIADLNTIEFGIKSSANSSDKVNKIYGTSNDAIEWHVFDKHVDEKSEYAQSNVVSGDDISRKTLVSVFRNNEGKKILEITLGVVNSPLTIGQMQNENNEYIYPEIGQLLEKLPSNPTGTEIFLACQEAIKLCEKHNYTDLKNLFRAFIFTGNAYVKLNDFNLSDHDNSGPNIITHKGDYSKSGKHVYDTEYISISELNKKKPVVVSKIYIPKSNTYGTVKLPIHPGHVGVFISYCKEYSPDDLMNIYLDEQSNKSTKPTVGFYYIIPPEATIDEYLNNYRNVYLNKTDNAGLPTRKIGNLWTSYHLLKNVYNNISDLDTDFFSNILATNWNFKASIENYLKKLNEINTKENWENDETYETLFAEYKHAYSNVNVAKKYAIKNTKIAKEKEILLSVDSMAQIPVYEMFNKYLMNAIYNKNGSINTDQLNTLKKYNSLGIKYKVSYKKTNSNNSIFIEADVNDNYTLSAIDNDNKIINKDFIINSKIDSPIFEIPELTEAIEKLASWEPDGIVKKISNEVNASTRAYLRDKKSKEKIESNFDKFKNLNIIYFQRGGILENFNPESKNDFEISQEEFAEKALTEINKIPSTIGFGILNNYNSVKLHVLNTSNDESESIDSLKNIIVGKPIIFKTLDDSHEFDFKQKHYVLTLSGGELSIQISQNDEVENDEKNHIENYTDEEHKNVYDAIKNTKHPAVLPILKIIEDKNNIFGLNNMQKTILKTSMDIIEKQNPSNEIALNKLKNLLDSTSQNLDAQRVQCPIIKTLKYE